MGILPEGYIYAKEERAVRDLLRKRSQLVRQRPSNLLSIQHLLTRNTGSSLSGNRLKQLTAAAVEQLLPQAELALAEKRNLAGLQCLEEQGDQIEETLPSIHWKQSLHRSERLLRRNLSSLVVAEYSPHRSGHLEKAASHARQ